MWKAHIKRRRVGWTGGGVLFMSHWFGWRNVAGGVIDGTVTEAVAVALGWDRPTVSDSWPCQHSLHRGPQMCFFMTGVTEVHRSGVTGFTVTDVQSAVRNLSPVLTLHISLQMSRHIFWSKSGTGFNMRLKPHFQRPHDLTSAVFLSCIDVFSIYT